MTQEALKLALEALEYWDVHGKLHQPTEEAITAIKEALAQPEEQHSCDKQEPVAWKPIETAPKDVMILVCLPRQMNLVVRAWYNSIHNFWQTDYEGEGGITRPMYFHEGDLWHPIPPLYTTPPQRTWVGLTDEDIAQGCKESWVTEQAWQSAVWWAEAKLKEKNT